MSTLDNISILISDIQLALTYNKCVGAAYLDLKSAYDNVCIDILINKLMELNLPHRFITNNYKIVSNRIVIVNFNGIISSQRITNMGLPQGGLFSPILYTLYIRELVKIFSPYIKVIEYADDIYIYIEGNDTENCIHRLDEAMHALNVCLFQNGIELSVDKSIVPFHVRKRTIFPPNILLGGHSLEVHQNVNFLVLQ